MNRSDANSILFFRLSMQGSLESMCMRILPVLLINLMMLNASGQRKLEHINRILNGNFENGHQGFFSDLNYSEDNPLPGYFTLTRKLQIADCNYQIPGDHTNGKGFYLLSRQAENKKIWRSYVEVSPHSRYRFTLHFCHLPVYTNDSDTHEGFSAVRILINKKEVSSVFYDPQNHLAWFENSVEWPSGTLGGLVEIAVSGDTRHYLAIDDITFVLIENHKAESEETKTLAGEKEEKFDLPFIRFEMGSDCLSPGSFEALDSLAAWLLQYSSRRIRLEGHTDALGNPDNLQKLSILRVKQVKNYLVYRGIKPERIFIYGFGGSRPIADNNDEELRHMNRRVELILF